MVSPEQGTLLVVIFPWVLHCPSQENCRRFCPRGKTPKSNPKPHSLAGLSKELVGLEGEWQRGEGQEGVSREQPPLSHRS